MDVHLIIQLSHELDEIKASFWGLSPLKLYKDVYLLQFAVWYIPIPPFSLYPLFLYPRYDICIKVYILISEDWGQWQS